MTEAGLCDLHVPGDAVHVGWAEGHGHILTHKARSSESETEYWDVSGELGGEYLGMFPLILTVL